MTSKLGRALGQERDVGKAFGRPDAQLFSSSATRQVRTTLCPPHATGKRPSHASAKATPSTLVMTSILDGGRPSVAVRSSVEN